MANRCNFTSCRFNEDGICENEDAREECVDMSEKVLCLDEVEFQYHAGTIDGFKKLHDRNVEILKQKYVVCYDDENKTPLWMCKSVEEGKKQIAQCVILSPCVIIEIETLKTVCRVP